MPIEFFEADGGVHVKQSFDSPTVYLDHWAIRLFSDDHELQDRLVNAVMAKGGTLLLSTFSFSEFTKASDARHCSVAEKFVERLLPNIFLTDFALDKVNEQELTEQDNARRFWPTADLPQLKLFAEMNQSSLLGFSMHGFITLAHTHRNHLSEVADSTAQLIKNAMENARKDSAYITKARNTLPSNNRTRTMIIMSELMRGFYLDPHAPIDENDIFDMIHAAMPLNCCDYVLLDGPWVERVEKMRLRIAKSQINMPIAKCFSQRNNGVLRFLEDLESF